MTDLTAEQIAAQCWCAEETKSIEMDVRLAKAIADRVQSILDRLNESEQIVSLIVSQDRLRGYPTAAEWGTLFELATAHMRDGK